MPPKKTGHFPDQPADPPFHHDHMAHFNAAMDDALKNWPTEDLQNMPVTLWADLSKNPGGVHQYHVQIGA
jgi:hypothetical protein